MIPHWDSVLVAQEIVLQVAVQDIGQLTDFEQPAAGG
jgi:hypothetical protein